eukprot:1630888-Pleurochrysis_carterae.AAC.1
MSRLRSSASAEWSLTPRSDGQKRLISLIHEESTESGATTKCGPGSSRSNLRCAKKAIVCAATPTHAAGRVMRGNARTAQEEWPSRE